MTVTWEPVALRGPEGPPRPAEPAVPALLPLDAGEQYRFRFEMDACVGCHSCEVACAEQNDLPVDVAWRKVGELEAGSFPDTRRFSLSMACNHCVEPTCLSGCPTEAYTKLANGVVTHDADECIGCQYCIWNCPYEVPVFDRTRKIVSKCDMCLPRLEAGQEPACVASCPTKALSVEPVDVAAWRAEHAEADGPGLPPSAITLSTTRVVAPKVRPGRPEMAAMVAVDDTRFEPEDPHWPLVALTLLTQLALGTVAATLIGQLAAGTFRGGMTGAAVAGALAGAVALTTSLFHLGRPAAALKALRNLRRSWLSREVALFPAFSFASFAFAAGHAGRGPFTGGAGTLGAGLAAIALGGLGVYASGRIYLVPARPVWNSRRTLASFFATAATTGPLLALACLDRSVVATGWVAVLLGVVAAGALTHLVAHAHLVRATSGAVDRQHRGTAVLLARFRGLVLSRFALMIVGLILVASVADVAADSAAAQGRIVGALVCLAAGELIGRYLFYVTVVPWRVAGSYVTATR